MAGNKTDIKQLSNQLEIMKENQDMLFLILTGAFIFQMQCGFAFLEAGSVRSKNTVNILMKNLMDLGIGAISFWAFGYAFAYGSPSNSFIGYGYFFASNGVLEVVTDLARNTTYLRSNPTTFHAYWFFQYVFAATAATIVSGAMAERTRFYAYLVYSFILTGTIYPVVAHWVWADDGWLRTGLGTGVRFQDFAGSTAIHACGGTAAFIGSKIVGPRSGRFTVNGSPRSIDGHSVASMSLGAFMLMVGFLAFNGGSVQKISGTGDGAEVSLAVMNTVIAAATSSLVATFVERIYSIWETGFGHWSLPTAINGALTGMVSMCSGCNDMQPWAAVVTSATAGACLVFTSRLVVRLKVDDPVDAVAVHLFGGVIGTLATPIFAIRGQTDEFGYGVGGIVYGGHQMAWKGLGWTLLGLITICSWTGILCTGLFLTLMHFNFLRISKHVEATGIDQHEHGDIMYPDIVIKNDTIANEIEIEIKETKIYDLPLDGALNHNGSQIGSWKNGEIPKEAWKNGKLPKQAMENGEVPKVALENGEAPKEAWKNRDLPKEP